LSREAPHKIYYLCKYVHHQSHIHAVILPDFVGLSYLIYKNTSNAANATPPMPQLQSQRRLPRHPSFPNPLHISGKPSTGNFFPSSPHRRRVLIWIIEGILQQPNICRLHGSEDLYPRLKSAASLPIPDRPFNIPQRTRHNKNHLQFSSPPPSTPPSPPSQPPLPSPSPPSQPPHQARTPRPSISSLSYQQSPQTSHPYSSQSHRPPSAHPGPAAGRNHRLTRRRRLRWSACGLRRCRGRRRGGGRIEGVCGWGRRGWWGWGRGRGRWIYGGDCSVLGKEVSGLYGMGQQWLTFLPMTPRQAIDGIAILLCFLQRGLNPEA
jgi:hypothetical protein